METHNLMQSDQLSSALNVDSIITVQVIVKNDRHVNNTDTPHTNKLV